LCKHDETERGLKVELKISRRNFIKGVAVGLSTAIISPLAQFARRKIALKFLSLVQMALTFAVWRISLVKG